MLRKASALRRTAFVASAGMPTSHRCHCQICRPERLNDPVDRQTVARVRKKGYTVIAVGTGDCDCCHDCEPKHRTVRRSPTRSGFPTAPATPSWS